MGWGINDCRLYAYVQASLQSLGAEASRGTDVAEGDAEGGYWPVQL